MNRGAMIKPFRALGVLLLPLQLIACGSHSSPSTERPPLDGAAIGGPFTLADKANRAVRWQDFDGRYRIVYFGYTSCPDACPMDMQKIAKGFALFAQQHPDLARQVQPIFITIDPARDDPQKVGEFAAAFSPQILGLTGTPAQVDQAARAFKVYYAKGKANADGWYPMDHQQTAFLMGRKGEPIALLPIDLPLAQAPQGIAVELAKWVK